MADSKIHELPELSNPAGKNLVYIVNDTGLSPSSHRATIKRVSTLRRLNSQVFTTSGTYTPTTGARGILVICIAGGGGGGAAQSTGSISSAAGGGGIAGMGVMGGMNLSDLNTPVTVTIGAGGAGGAVGFAGTTGGNTEFGDTGQYLWAEGGDGGQFASSGGGFAAEDGGFVVSDKQVHTELTGLAIYPNLAVLGTGLGASGWAGRFENQRACGGWGGSGIFGGGAGSKHQTGTDSSAAGDTGDFAGGGGGGAATDDVASAAGGDGANGMVIILEFGDV